MALAFEQTSPPVAITYNFWADILVLDKCNPLLGALRIIALTRKTLLERYLQLFSTHNKALVNMWRLCAKIIARCKGSSWRESF